MDHCTAYNSEGRRPYDERKARYQVAAEQLHRSGLNNEDTLMDLGAGGTELDYCLRREHDWRGRYVPVDGWIDGTDLETWTPARPPAWFAALEIVEHLQDPQRLIEVMKRAGRGFVLTTPNPAVVDVLAMDSDHVHAVTRTQLQAWGLHTSVHTFYGTPDDGLCGLWTKEPVR
ncbi:hypothetical protein DMB38_25970 [Streptomyces sp. WAC 06738]|nr:hypothetical protein DMB38_25970 [Streptomyces sp. WAC 06738]